MRKKGRKIREGIADSKTAEDLTEITKQAPKYMSLAQQGKSIRELVNRIKYLLPVTIRLMSST